jgi:hypothetical protein
MTSPHFNLPKLAKLTLLGLCCSMVVLAFAPQALTQNNGGLVEGDHGDDPVIGSLPIKFMPILDQLFPATDLRFNLPNLPNMPIFGLRSSSRLTDDIITASGQPFGGLNSREDRSILGLARDGLVVVHRDRLSHGQARLTQWVTNEFIGGEIIISTNSGVFTLPITADLIEIPAREIVNQRDFVVFADITISPNPTSGSNPLHLVLSTAGSMVTIVYTAQ